MRLFYRGAAHASTVPPMPAVHRRPLYITRRVRLNQRSGTRPVTQISVIKSAHDRVILVHGKDSPRNVPAHPKTEDPPKPFGLLRKEKHLAALANKLFQV